MTIGNVVANETSTTVGPHWVDFVECGIDTDDFTITYIHLATVFRVQLGASAWQITTTTNTDKVVTPIAVFYP